jgi:hypothetical protein
VTPTRGKRQIDSWIDSIENGRMPNLVSDGLNQAASSPVAKITERVMRSSFSHEQVSLECGPEKPLLETQTELEKLRAAYLSQTNSSIRAGRNRSSVRLGDKATGTQKTRYFAQA